MKIENYHSTLLTHPTSQKTQGILDNFSNISYTPSTNPAYFLYTLHTTISRGAPSPPTSLRCSSNLSLHIPTSFQTSGWYRRMADHPLVRALTVLSMSVVRVVAESSHPATSTKCCCPSSSSIVRMEGMVKSYL